MNEFAILSLIVPAAAVVVGYFAVRYQGQQMEQLRKDLEAEAEAEAAQARQAVAG